MWEQNEQYLLHKTLTICDLLRQCQNSYSFTFPTAFLLRYFAHLTANDANSIAQKTTLLPTYDI